MRSLKNKLNKEIKRISYVFSKIESVVDYDNIFHCTIHKAGSQWIRGILEDKIIYKYTKLKPINIYDNGTRSHIYSKINGLESGLEYEVKNKKIITPIYIDYNTFVKKLNKSQKFKCFFVKRDPRDLVVSHYFSKKYSHVMSGNISEFRKKLNNLSIENGLIMLIDFLERDGTFDALRSWEKNSSNNIKIVKFENLSGSNGIKYFDDLFEFLNIGLPHSDLKKILNKYNFENMSKGRNKGEENKRSHYRKGVHGDFVNYFNDKVIEHFYNVTGTLVEDLGYQK